MARVRGRAYATSLDWQAAGTRTSDLLLPTRPHPQVDWFARRDSAFLAYEPTERAPTRKANRKRDRHLSVVDGARAVGHIEHPYARQPGRGRARTRIRRRLLRTQRVASRMTASLSEWGSDELLSLVVPALVVARLGEADHHSWWRSNGASVTGAFVLEDRFPRTWRVLGLEIALVAAEGRHREEFGDEGEFVHLFSAKLGAARLAREWLAERKTESAEADLVAALHSKSTSELEALVPTLAEPPDAVIFGGRARVGEISAEELQDPARRQVTVQLLARALVDVPHVLPYLERVGPT